MSILRQCHFEQLVFSPPGRFGDRVFRTGTMLIASLCFALTVANAEDWTDSEIRKLQEALIWTTDYDGLVDGKIGAGTREAITKFQEKIGHTPTGSLSSSEYRELLKVGTAKRTALGFAQYTDETAGVSVGIPHALVPNPTPTRLGTQWSNAQSDISINTLRLESDITFLSLFNKLKTINRRKVTYERFVDDDWFVIAALEGDAAVYVKANLVTPPDQKPEIRGFSVWMGKNRPSSYQAIPPAMLSSFRWSTDKKNDASTTTPISGILAPVRPDKPPVVVENPPPRPIVATGTPSSAKNCINGLGDCAKSLGFR